MPLYRWIGGTNAHVLPVPLMNVVNGGAHAQNSLDFQEFMLVPAGAETFSRGAADRRRDLPRTSSGCSTSAASRRRSATRAASRPTSAPPYDACEAILEAAERAGHRDKVALALDPATSELHRDGAYRLERQGGTLDTDGMIDLWADLCDRFPIVSIEDGLGEYDWDGLADAHRPARRARCSSSATTSSSPTSTSSAAGSTERVGNAILVKVNQIGTLTETLDAVELAHRNGYRAVISHRSGETEDATIADLAVATNAGQIKTGAPARSDRVAKYNQLLRIEEELGDEAEYPGWAAFPRSAA